MNKINKFLERIKIKPKELPKTINENEENRINNIEIKIEGEIKLFENEEEIIIQGARELLQQGRAVNMQEAVITFAVMFRGLKYKGTQITDNGKQIIVLGETLQDEIDIIDRYDENSR